MPEDPDPPTLIYPRGVALFLLLAAPLAYSCIVPLNSQLHRANPLAAFGVVFLFGVPFIAPFILIFGPIGSFKFIAWFWRKMISGVTDVHLAFKTYIFSIYLILLLINLGILCWVSPSFLKFMNKYGRWIGDAFDTVFGPWA